MACAMASPGFWRAFTEKVARNCGKALKNNYPDGMHAKFNSKEPGICLRLCTQPRTTVSWFEKSLYSFALN